MQPMALAGLFTLGAVGLSLRFVPPPRLPLAVGLLLAFAVLFLLLQVVPEQRRRVHAAVLLLMPPVALGLYYVASRVGAAQVMLVVWAACLFGTWTPRAAIAALSVGNIAFYLVARRLGFDSALTMVLINVGFQCLAALCVHYARSAERSRDQLAQINADLLATRALLADSARDAERLRVARELHDVAGHKLTAMRLNLRALATDPALAGRPELALAERLSGELLADIRQVVQSLRDDRGLDLATALRALAAPFPRPVLALSIAPEVRVTDPAVAEALLRLAQEALTNAARHAGAQTVWLDIGREAEGLRVDIRDDGSCPERIREGNGIAGMRERVAELGGALALERTRAGGLHLVARLPA